MIRGVLLVVCERNNLTVFAEKMLHPSKKAKTGKPEIRLRIGSWNWIALHIKRGAVDKLCHKI